jgi:hypothetical protein
MQEDQMTRTDSSSSSLTIYQIADLRTKRTANLLQAIFMFGLIASIWQLQLAQAALHQQQKTAQLQFEAQALEFQRLKQDRALEIFDSFIRVAGQNKGSTAKYKLILEAKKLDALLNEESIQLGNMTIDESSAKAVNSYILDVLNVLEKAAICCNKGIADPLLVEQLIGPAMTAHYEKLEPYIKAQREKTKDPNQCKELEHYYHAHQAAKTSSS